MADLREAVRSLGHRDVATYVQSGNVVLTSDVDDPAVVAAGVARALADRTALSPDVVALTRADLAQVVVRNPFPDEDDGTRLHVVLVQGGLGPGGPAAVADAVARARAKGSPDDARVVDGVLYLHTPDGLGRSELAAQLTRRAVVDASGGPATTRNWRTVTRLLELLDAD
ncbi:DUF1697 domain-containing protein [Cellulomonas sp. ATA003]|uniref:DUF1697 domain-containing protein n=1 Tax=Cellulomonas sp. ATA003 TaxID=3073064 RepID=UPI002873C6B9|nr:DUF1697 domain-containing protein [Cellulomonas sp. ATA003]WNB84392.1 DUF1697 domain-containing protein [Cellulomonas sp. ATA003]